ncbi:hypothetical protein C8R46DRAFT_1231019 [Mycena filopes]|nr:hypothetical protein C8R46DRAFT_1231019 [Mycena filopes]
MVRKQEYTLNASNDSSIASIKFQKFVRIVKNSAYGDDLLEFFGRTSNAWLLAAATEDSECWAKVVLYVKSVGSPVSVPTSESSRSVLRRVPLEIRHHILDQMDIRTRVRFAATSRQHRAMVSGQLHFHLTALMAQYNLSFLLVRFVLIATGSLLGGYPVQTLIYGTLVRTDAVSFFTTPEWTEDILAFLEQTSDYVADQHPHQGVFYDIWTLRAGSRTLRVIECHQTPIAAITVQSSAHRMGYFDGDALRHPCPSLASSGLTFATPNTLHFADTLAGHRLAWAILQKAIRRGWRWMLEYESPHTCWKDWSCPASGRHSEDRGWLNLNLSGAHYGRAMAQPRTTWSFAGIGCEDGEVDGKHFEAVVTPAGKCGMVRVRTKPHGFAVQARVVQILPLTDAGNLTSRLRYLAICLKQYTFFWRAAIDYKYDDVLGARQNMPSIHRYVLAAFVKFLDDSTTSLYNADLFATYNWLVGENGAVSATGPNGPQGPVAYPQEFTVFGIVRSLRGAAGVVIGTPHWHNEGVEGSGLTVRYHQQILALARALKSRDLDGFFDSDEILLTTATPQNLRPGLAVFAQATLSINAEIEIGREEHYTLNVVRIEALHPIA